MPDAILGMGFGHAEIGTVTPLPQQGNPRPRIFRLIRDRALINRLGFNNSGHAAAHARLAAARRRRRDRGQCRRQQGRGRPRGRLCGGRARLLRRGELFHDQRVLSQHARPARSAGAGGVGRAGRARLAGARGADVGGKAQAAGGGQAGARHRRGRPGADRAGACRARRRRHRRVEYDAGARRPHRDCAGEGSRRHLRAPAVPPLDRHAGPRLRRSRAERCR